MFALSPEFIKITKMRIVILRIVKGLYVRRVRINRGVSWKRPTGYLETPVQEYASIWKYSTAAYVVGEHNLLRDRAPPPKKKKKNCRNFPSKHPHVKCKSCYL